MAGLVSASFKQGKGFMKILILQDTIANQKKVFAGDVIEVEQSEANILIGYGKSKVSNKTEKKESNRSVGLKSSDAPKPKKRSKAK